MVDIKNATSAAASIVRTTPVQRAAYADAGEVSRRANVMNDGDSPENLASLSRLDRALSAGEPLRSDVPRGFYLNIRV